MRPLSVPSVLELDLELNSDFQVKHHLHTLLEQERVVRHVMERERNQWQQYHANLLDQHDKATRTFFDQLTAERRKVEEWRERAETAMTKLTEALDVLATRGVMVAPEWHEAARKAAGEEPTGEAP